MIHFFKKKPKSSPPTFPKQEGIYDSLSNSILDAIMIFTAETHEFVEANEPCLKLYGYTREEFLRLKQEDITAEAEKSKESIRRTFDGEVKRIPIRYHRKKDGTVFPVEITPGTFVFKGRKLVCGIVRDVSDRVSMEEALKNTKERLDLALKGAKSGTWDWNIKTGEVLYDRLWVEMIGYEEGELRPNLSTWKKLLHPDDRDTTMIHLNRHFEDEHCEYKVKFRMKCKNGDWKWILASGRVFERDAEGTPVRMIGTHVDIDEMKNMELQLKEQKERSEEYLNAAQVMVVGINKEKEVFLVNDKACEVLGYAREEIIGKNWFEHFLPERFKKEILEVSNRLMSGKTASVEHFENPVLTKEQEERLIAWHNVVLKDEKGKISSHLGCGEDITERRKAEEILKERERLLSEVEKIAKIGAWEMDLEHGGKATWTQGTYDIVEMKKGDPIPGFNDHINWYLPEYREMIAHKMRELVEAKKPMQFKAILQTKKGNLKWCQAFGEAIVENGEVVKLKGTFQDISDQKIIEDKILNLSKFPKENPNPVLRLDAKGNVIHKNPEVDRILKQSGLFWNNVHQILPDNIKDIVKKVLSGKQTIRYLEKTVSNRTFGYDLMPIFESQYVNLYGRDITDRKKAEEALMEAKEEMDLIVNSANDIIFQLTPLGIVKYCNPQIENVLGYKPEELNGKFLGATPYYEFPKALKAVYKILSGGEVRGLELHQRHKNGHIVITEINGTAIKRNGKITALQGIMRDITDRKKAEADLKKNETKFRTIFDSSRDAVMTLEAQGKFLSGNKATIELFRCSSEEDFCSKSPADLSPQFQPDGQTSQKKAASMMAIAMKKGSHFFEWTHKRLNGDEFFATVLLTRMELDGKEILQATVRDITEQKKTEERERQLQEQLHHAQRMESIGTMANGIAHNFNNILAAVRGYIEMASMHIPSESQTYSDLKDAIKGIEDAKNLSAQMMTFSRKNIQELKKIKINSVVEEAVEMFKASIGGGGLSNKISYSISPKCGFVLADPGELKQVIMNLCINAYHAIQNNNGMIVINLNEMIVDQELRQQIQGLNEKRYVRLSIKDTGVGMDQATKKRIFEPFFTTKEVGKGTGLGLSVVHGIISNYNGKIDVESELGKGTTFNIYLPVVGL